MQTNLENIELPKLLELWDLAEEEPSVVELRFFCQKEYHNRASSFLKEIVDYLDTTFGISIVCYDYVLLKVTLDLTYLVPSPRLIITLLSNKSTKEMYIGIENVLLGGVRYAYTLLEAKSFLCNEIHYCLNHGAIVNANQS